MKTRHTLLITTLIAASAGVMAQQSAPMAAPDRGARMLERLKAADTDKDGLISKAEADKAMPHLAKRFDELDTNKDGKLSQDELRAMADHMPRGPRGSHDGHDGPWGNRSITRDELVQHQQKMLADFDAADINKDGKLSPEERKTWHDKMHAEHHAGNPPPKP